MVVYNVVTNFDSVKLERAASYRTSTTPIDISVTGNIIVVADVMKSTAVVEYRAGNMGVPDSLTEVARHFQTVWVTAVGDIAENTYLESDGEGNLIVLRRNVNGATPDDRRRLEVTSEMLLGDMVNRIRPVNIQQISSVAVTPKAFLGTVCALNKFYLDDTLIFVFVLLRYKRKVQLLTAK